MPKNAAPVLRALEDLAKFKPINRGEQRLYYRRNGSVAAKSLGCQWRLEKDVVGHMIECHFKWRRLNLTHCINGINAPLGRELSLPILARA